MSLFAKAQEQATNVKTEEKDVLGGGFTFPGGIHKSGIKMMYLDAWPSGALFVAVELAVLVDGQEKTYKENITISNKAGDFTYKDKQNGEDKAMPGYATIDSLLKLATGKGFAQQSPEVKSVKVYDKDAQGEVPKEKEVFTEALRKTLNVGFILANVDKTSKNESTGKYEPTGETREQNEISKLFNDALQTINELEANKPAEFHKGWTERFAGKTIDKAKGKPKGAPTAGAPNAAGSENPLFG